MKTDHTISRRDVLRGTAALAGAGALGLTLGRGAWVRSVAAADAGLASLGLPTIDVTYGDDGYSGVPASLAAGRYLVSITNKATTSGTDSAVAAFVLLPDGVTADNLFPATPAADAAASPEANGDNPPAWFYTTALAGGPSATPGTTVRGVIDLAAGNWMVWNEDTEGNTRTAALTVTGDAPASPAAPTAAVTVTEVKTADGYMFQLDGTLAHGKQVIQVINTSDEPHFLLMVGSPVPLTMDQVQTLLSLPDGATPEPSSGLPDPSKLETGVYAGSQSAGVTQWIEADLDLDTYVLLCFITDPNKGNIPHAFEGMVDILTVGAPATPTS